MIRRTRYLRWAVEHVGSEYDLASSGIRPFAEGELPPPEGPADVRAYGALVTAIARYNGIPEESVVPTLGASHALFVAMSALLEPGDDALVETPAYEPLVAIPELLGARVVHFERRESARYTLEPERIAEAITRRTRVIVVSNHHNPTGAFTPPELLAEVAALAASRGAVLLVDEVYAPFSTFGVKSGAFGSAIHVGQNVVCVSSLTKCWGAGPHRVGWVLAEEPIAERCKDHLLTTLGHLPVGHAALGAHLFKHLPLLTERARRGLDARRERVAAWMASRPDLSWSAPEHGLFGLAISRRAGDLLSLIELGQREHDVLVVPGSFFGIPNGFRLAWSLPDDKLEPALARLATVLPG